MYNLFFFVFFVHLCVVAVVVAVVVDVILSFFVCIYCVETIVAPLGYIIRMICIHFLLLIAYIPIWRVLLMSPL